MKDVDSESLKMARNNLRVFVKYHDKIKNDPNLTAAIEALDAVIRRRDGFIGDGC